MSGLLLLAGSFLSIGIGIGLLQMFDGRHPPASRRSRTLAAYLSVPFFLLGLILFFRLGA